MDESEEGKPFDAEEMVRLSKEMSALEERQRRGFFWHWQNLRGKKQKGIHGRAWLYHRPRGVFGIEWRLPSRLFHLYVIVGGDENQVRFSIALWFVALYFKFEQWAWLNRWKVAKSYHGKEIRLSIHSWALWWNIWTPEYEWHSTTPKWRQGCFDIPDFFLGRNEYTCEYGDKQEVSFEMPESTYIAEVKPMVQTWKRPRWPYPRVRHGFDIDIPGGVPIPGKGESEWDCGEDAIMSTGSSASTVPGAIADLVKSIHQTRERYGGKNWRPQKTTA